MKGVSEALWYPRHSFTTPRHTTNTSIIYVKSTKIQLQLQSKNSHATLTAAANKSPATAHSCHYSLQETLLPPVHTHLLHRARSLTRSPVQDFLYFSTWEPQPGLRLVQLDKMDFDTWIWTTLRECSALLLLFCVDFFIFPWGWGFEYYSD